jgi:predicted RNase H-like HicB family nuclease
VTQPKENFSVLIQPAQVSGQWLAHVLELDVMTQGNSVAHAFDMAAEAAKLVCAENERDAWRRSPEEDWRPFYEIMNDGATFEESADVPDGAWVAAIIEVETPATAHPVLVVRKRIDKPHHHHASP